MSGNIQTILDAYVECALWADEPEGYDGQVWSDEALAEAWGDCQSFLDAFHEELEETGNYSQAGHDLWLTRNGHGAGFWDRSDDVWTPEMRERMTAFAKQLGECWLHLNDEGEIDLA